MMSSSTIATAPVIITVPKYVAITPLAKIKPAPASSIINSTIITSPGSMSPTNSDSGSCVFSIADDVSTISVPKAKKRRLDHLTWEEKVQRKKLKNRVAAQTSRDRKKARMEEMENELKDLNDKTEILQNKCESLQAINDSLLEKNHKLDMEVELLRQQVVELQQQKQQQQQQQQQQKKEAQSSLNNANVPNTNTVTTCAGCESIFNGSAVSNTDPLQQGSPQMDLQSTQEQLKRNSTLAALWRIVALCLLYKTSSLTTSSMPGNWKNLPKVCSQISQQTWRQAIERAMKLLPKLQAEQSDCLDQWWGPQQSAWNPANIATQQTHKVAA